MADLPRAIEFLPGTNEPAPAAMTAEEACQYLRLDEGRDIAAAIKALNRLVEKDKIRPCIVGKLRRYWRHELDRYLAEETERYGEVA